MLTTHFALVPFDPGAKVDRRQLLQVAAALQIQVVRDFSPLWDVSGTVSAFDALEDVPPEYVPIMIIGPDVPIGYRGFHFVLGGQPFAVVQNRANWSLAASHELLEMLWDSTGATTAAGPSLADDKMNSLKGADGTAEVIEGVSAYRNQGQVDYLMEICDPCESSTYRINGVLVSDFVTPDYYGTFHTAGNRYSFMGRLRQPRQLIEGGYLSWRSRVPAGRTPANTIYQASAEPHDGPTITENALQSRDQPTADPHDLTIRILSEVPARFSRDWIDLRTTKLFVIPRREYKLPSNNAWAKSFRSEMQQLFKWLNTKDQRPPSLDDIIALVEYLATNAGNKDFSSMSQTARRKYLKDNHPRLANSEPRDDVPSASEYKKILKYLKEQKKLAGLFGVDAFEADMSLWLCMLTN